MRLLRQVSKTVCMFWGDKNFRNHSRSGSGVTVGYRLKLPSHGSDHERVTRGNWLSVNLPYRGTAESSLESEPRTSRKGNQRSLIEPCLKLVCRCGPDLRSASEHG